ncbi:hypothetical protein NPIL_129121, partial [Nephila pilipes]
MTPLGGDRRQPKRTCGGAEPADRDSRYVGVDEWCISGRCCLSTVYNQMDQAVFIGAISAMTDIGRHHLVWRSRGLAKSAARNA